jgi:hypothetical protein
MIVTAIKRAYSTARARGWDRIYWAIDLHGVCFKSNYVVNDYQFINDDVLPALQMLSLMEESVLILWSSAHPEEQKSIIKFFAEHGVQIDFFNENPLEANTATGCFDKKFYFSVLLDDKAGFDPDVDWDSIVKYFVFEGESL